MFIKSTKISVKKPAMKLGFAFGGLILLLALGMYYGILKGSAPYFHLKFKVLGKVAGFGLNSLWAYAAFATSILIIAGRNLVKIDFNRAAARRIFCF